MGRQGDLALVRELGCQVAEVAAKPIQAERRRLWKALNAKRPERPMVMIDQIPWHEMNVEDELTLRCEDPFLRSVENTLRQTLYRDRHMAADFFVEDHVDVPRALTHTGWGLEIDEDVAVTDAHNDIVGHLYHDQLAEPGDVAKIQAPRFSEDVEESQRREALTHEALDGVLGVRMQGHLPWVPAWDLISQWRGPEAVYVDLAERPDHLHAIMKRTMDAAMEMLDGLEAGGFLDHPAPWVHCTGAFTDELPKEGFSPARPRAKDTWTFGMAQVFSAVSPAMHREFEMEHVREWYARFGLVYYGCCEPLDDRVDLIHLIPNVRKVSMSPFVDVRRGAEAIGKDFVYSRKPPPAFLAPNAYDLDVVERDLRETIAACRDNGCALELILKDISTVRYEPTRLWEWERLAMRLVQG